MDVLKIGVIGAGRIGRVHSQNLALQPSKARLIAISDVRPEAAKSLADELKIPSVHEDYRRILSDPQVDAVLICSSTDTHAEIIEEAAEAGKHIFCEKPVDLNLNRVRQALESVEKAGVFFQLGFNRRFDPNFSRIAEMIRNGEVGTPQLLRISSRDPEPPPSEYIATSGGIFLDMTIHDFDMARFLIDDEIDEIYATGSVLIDPKIAKHGDLDTATVTLKYKGGAICVIDNSRKAVYGYDQRIEVFGSKGCALAPNLGPTQIQFWNEMGQTLDRSHYFFVERYAEAYRIEIDHFVESVLKGFPPKVGGNDGLISLAMGLAAKRSFQERRTVKLKEILEEK